MQAAISRHAEGAASPARDYHCRCSSGCTSAGLLARGASGQPHAATWPARQETRRHSPRCWGAATRLLAPPGRGRWVVCAAPPAAPLLTAFSPNAPSHQAGVSRQHCRCLFGTSARGCHSWRRPGRPGMSGGSTSFCSPPPRPAPEPSLLRYTSMPCLRRKTRLGGFQRQRQSGLGWLS